MTLFFPLGWGDHIRLNEIFLATSGLEWKDVDFDNNVITVDMQRQYIRGYGTFVTLPKTESGLRYITVSGSVMDLLKRYKKQQKAERLKIGNLWKLW